MDYIEIDKFAGKYWQEIATEVVVKMNEMIAKVNKLEARVKELERHKDDMDEKRAGDDW